MFANVKFPFDVNFIDYPDDDSFSTIVFFMGCEHNCKNCHNECFRDFKNQKNTKLISFEEFKEQIKIAMQKNNSDSLILSGGDPLYKKNIEFVKMFLTETNYNTCIYTGHDIEYVKRNNIKNFKYIKIGNYSELQKQKSEKTNDYIQFSSCNQELYDNNYEKLSKFGRFNFNKIV
jgi:organic radical activating enzyme